MGKGRRERDREREGVGYSIGLFGAGSTVRDDKLISCHPEAPRGRNILLNSVKS